MKLVETPPAFEWSAAANLIENPVLLSAIDSETKVTHIVKLAIDFTMSAIHSFGAAIDSEMSVTNSF